MIRRSIRVAYGTKPYDFFKLQRFILSPRHLQTLPLPFMTLFSTTSTPEIQFGDLITLKSTNKPARHEKKFLINCAPSVDAF